MINSKQKGKRGELLFCKLCREYGYEVRRTAQYCGLSEESADVIGLPGVHVECKLQERLNLRDAMAQSIRDAEQDGGMPIVAHKKNNAPWLITMRAEDFFQIYEAWKKQFSTKEKGIAAWNRMCREWGEASEQL